MPSYTLAHAHEVTAAIKAACPDAHIENWQDFGFTVTVVAPDWKSALVVLRPPWPSGNRPEIVGTAEDAIKWWNSQPKPQNGGAT